MDGLGLALPEQAFWLLSLAFYLADQLVLRPPGHLVLIEQPGGRWLPALPHPHTRLRRRQVSLLPAWTPWRAAVTATWLPPTSPGAARHAARRLGLTRRRLRPYHRLTGLVALTIFGIGPALTAWRGLGQALLLVLPLHLAWLAGLGWLLARHRPPGLDRGGAASLLFECAVCPGYFANLLRRLSLRPPALPVDPLGLAGLDPAATARLRHQLDMLLDDLAEQDDVPATDLTATRDWLAAGTPDASADG